MIKRLSFLLSLLIICTLPAKAFSVERELVLVSYNKNSIQPLDLRDLRRMYLGLQLKGSATVVTPIGNRSDNNSHEVFLQKIVHMSSRAYERHLLTKVFVHGTQRLRVADTQEQLVKALKFNENAISYMWASEAQGNSEITIIQSIWKGNFDR